MAIPRKGSRTIGVGGERYRWVVTVHQHALNLTVERADGAGQRLIAVSEPHDEYVRDDQGAWRFRGQLRSVTPGLVRQVILLALDRGWRPGECGLPPLRLYGWVEPLARLLGEGSDLPAGSGVRLRDIAGELTDELRGDISLDPSWRRCLRDAAVHLRFPIPADDEVFAPRLAAKAREYGLSFVAFNEGFTDSGWFVIGVESVEFPGTAAYSTNNPDEWCDPD